MAFDLLSMILYAIITFLIIFIAQRKLGSNRKSSCNKSVKTDNENFDYEVAIIGSGILGSALATVLGRDGRKVVVVEKNMEMPERFVGEFMQPRGIMAMKELGLQECLENIDVQNTLGVNICGSQGNKAIDFIYPLDSNGVGGLGLVNGRLVMNLRRAAMSEKNVTYLEGTVTNLLEINEVVTGFSYKNKDDLEEKDIKAKLTIVADGCFSKFRKELVNEKPEQLCSCIAGLTTEYWPSIRSDRVHILLTRPNIVLFYRITSDSTRVLVFMREKIPTKDLKNYLNETVCPQLPENFKDPFSKAIASSTLHSMPCNKMPSLPKEKKGTFILGDALSMRHPITAGGMTFAFCDILILRKLLSDVKDLSDYKVLSIVSKQCRKLRRSHSFVINVLANFIHEICSANDEWTMMIQKAYICFINHDVKDYQTSLFLFTSLDTRIVSLLRHLISGAIYITYSSFKENFSLFIFTTIYKTLRTIGRMFAIISPLLWSEMKTFL